MKCECWFYGGTALQHTSSFLLHLVAVFTLVIATITRVKTATKQIFPDFVLGISAFLTARMYDLNHRYSSVYN